jgi:hypothetical protein
MIRLKKWLPFFKEYFIQSIIYFIVQISPLGSLGWKLGVFEKSIFERKINKNSFLGTIGIYSFFLRDISYPILYYLPAIFIS